MIISNQNTTSVAYGPAVAAKQQAPSKHRRTVMSRIKPSVAAIYFSVFALVVAMVSVGYHEPKASSAVVNAANSSNQVDQTSVDNVVATNVASTVAQAVNLPIANSVANLAVSAQIKSELSQSDSVNTTKPQIIGSITENRSVIKYTVQAGDTVGTLATKYKISAQTIKWANDLTTDALSVGSILKILPFNGVLYVVESGDTYDSIAKKYNVDKTRLVTKNDLEESGLKPNTSIVLPDGVLPEDERPGYVAPIVYTSYAYNVPYGYSGGDVTYLNVTNWNNPCGMSDSIRNYLPGISSLCNSSGGNTMSRGQCTWWAWERRNALGRPLPGSPFGNAYSWTGSLKGYGYSLDSTPQAGDVFQGGNHVGIVESITKDNVGRTTSFTTSEMNYPYTPYQVVSRTIPANNFNNFNYIH